MLTLKFDMIEVVDHDGRLEFTMENFRDGLMIQKWLVVKKKRRLMLAYDNGRLLNDQI